MRQVLEELITFSKVDAIFENQSNSILFIYPSKKKVIGALYKANKDFEFEISLRSCRGYITVNTILRIKIYDFSNPKKSINEYPYASFKIEKNEANLSSVIYSKIQDDHRHLTRQFASSPELQHIIGRRPMPRYAILNSFSKYALTNKLVLKRSDIAIQGKLKHLVEKNCVLVNENEMFRILKDNIKPNVVQNSS